MSHPVKIRSKLYSTRCDSLISPTHVGAHTYSTLSQLSAVLYGDLDVPDIRNPDTLWIFLVTQRDLTSLMHTLHIPAWAWAQTRVYPMPRILAHMDSLRFLTLPSFYLHILRHHTAILNLGIHIHLSGQAKRELLKWLDSQTNMVSFRFPFLLDNDGDTSPLMPFPPTLTCTRLPPVPTMPSPPFMPPLSSLPPTPTLTEDIQAPFCSSILQP